MWNFYVYKHYKESDDTIFYVGKGVSRAKTRVNYERANDRSRSKFWKNIVNKHGCRVEIVASCKTNEEAHRLEITLIAEIGRRDLGKGPLINRTDGGEGSIGAVLTDAQREVRRQKMIEQHIKDPTLRIKAAAARTKQGGNGGVLKKGDKLPKAWREAIAKGVTGPRNTWYGKATPISRKVKNINTGIIYPSIARAAKAEGIEDVDLLYRCIFLWRNENLYPHMVLVNE